MTKQLVFLKLGGSLITDKSRPRTPRIEVIERLGAEIYQALNENPDLSLVIGHGSGSFGHVAAHRHNTRQGVRGAAQWRGFAQVWQDARALNQIVVQALVNAGLPLIALPPSASLTAADGKVARWELAPLVSALDAGLIPLINGDVIFDTVRGGTILSTEELFTYLAVQLRPARILLAGIEPGVWSDFPTCKNILHRITLLTMPLYEGILQESRAVDVTGGMRKKVRNMIDLIKNTPLEEACIFSGAQPGLTFKALSGESPGTSICPD